MRLRDYIIRRLILIIPTLIGVTILIFLIAQLFTPSQRAALYCTSLSQCRDIPGIIEQYNLRDPIYVQYISWIQEILKGNLGYSASVKLPVFRAIMNFLPTTVEMTLYAVPLTVFLGIRLGIASAMHKDSVVDHLSRSASIIGWSLPSFLLGLLLLSAFSGIFPTGGRLSVDATVLVNSEDFIRYTHMNTVDALLNGRLQVFLDAAAHLVLPVLTLTTVQIALIMRLMRSSMLESLSKGYITTARSKGLREKDVVSKHARKNALLPVITVSGILFSTMLSGLVVVETVFNQAGIGSWAASAAIQLDIPAILGFALLSGILFIFVNLVVDILYTRIDPRIRLG